MTDTGIKEMAGRCVDKFCSVPDPLEAQICEADQCWTCEEMLKGLTATAELIQNLEQACRQADRVGVVAFTPEDETFFESLYRKLLARADEAEVAIREVTKQGFVLDNLPGFRQSVIELRQMLEQSEWARTSAAYQDAAWE